MMMKTPFNVGEATAATVHDWYESDDIVLVDVRETGEYEAEHIPGALLLPMSHFDAELFPRFSDKKIVLYCAIGKRSEAAGKMLLKEGHFNVFHMGGGMNAWKAAGFETEAVLVAAERTAFVPASARQPAMSGV